MGVAMPVPYQPKDLLRALRSTALEATALASRVLLYPTGVLHEAPLEAGSPRVPGPRPVVLVHGFIDNRSVFTLLRRSLRQHDWPTVIGFNYSPLSCDIRATAQQVSALVEDVCACTGHRQVDIVSHSLGGLVARYYVQQLGGASRVNTLISLATPHQGTRAVPALSAHPLVRQIRPGSEFMQELALPVSGCGTRFISFWSDLDLVMSPPETARLQRVDLQVREISVEGVGHLAMPKNALVIADVRRELLETSPLTRNDRGDDVARSRDTRTGTSTDTDAGIDTDKGDASGVA